MPLFTFTPTYDHCTVGRIDRILRSRFYHQPAFSSCRSSRTMLTSQHYHSGQSSSSPPWNHPRPRSPTFPLELHQTHRRHSHLNSLRGISNCGSSSRRRRAKRSVKTLGACSSISSGRSTQSSKSTTRLVGLAERCHRRNRS